MSLRFKYNFIAGNEEREDGWLGVIFDDKPNDEGLIEVITVGVEDTEEEIIEWCEGSVESMNSGGDELPDRAER